MREFPVRTPEQLGTLLQAFRKQAGLTQAETAARLGVRQQTLSALERNAASASARRLLELLAVLGVEVVLRRPADTEPARDADEPRQVDW
ncbi:MAG TPA: helix-turn-helix transcriptional regulator [Burkholderiaceae bacterium]|nr:helix-turn-helix transcriptional regulator [Burkholderiaceae bacterium]